MNQTIDADGLKTIADKWPTLSQEERDCLVALVAGAKRTDLHAVESVWPGQRSEHEGVLGRDHDVSMIVIRPTEFASWFLWGLTNAEHWIEVLEVERDGRLVRVFDVCGDITEVAPPAVREAMIEADRKREERADQALAQISREAGGDGDIA